MTRLLLTLALLPALALAADPRPAEPAKKVTPEEATKLDAQYVPGPDSKPQDGVPRGKLTKHEFNDSKVYPGTVRSYSVYVPAQYDGKTPACLFVCQDGVMYSAPTVFDNLIHKKQMPVTIGVFIQPGDVPPKDGQPAPKRPDGRPAPRKNRSAEYDTLSDKYATFLLTEILPAVAKDYKISDNPDDRCVAGSSSGGICAFTVCWEKPDAFRKVFSTVGSFTNIRGGNKYPDLVRAADKKPIRVFMQDGENDLTNQFGSWPEANKAMYAALKEKGYDVKFEFGHGVHSARHGTALFPDAMRWLWRDHPAVAK
ncbi:MAG TPA: alpha/beta hydrolase-fold protein [Tepidisphaeraceae bacterium]|nr:alpha/beta hydrolase-fold protein [Tepidisphaeraceae bacterium]